MADELHPGQGPDDGARAEFGDTAPVVPLRTANGRVPPPPDDAPIEEQERWLHEHEEPRLARHFPTVAADPEAAQLRLIEELGGRAIINDGRGARREALEADERRRTVPPPVRFRMLDELTIDRDVFWLIDGKLPRGSMVMVYGRSGGGKTYLFLSLGLGIAAGRWFDDETEPGSVLYCAFERPGDASDRLAALRDRLNFRRLPFAMRDLAGRPLNEDLAIEIIADAKMLAKSTGQPCRAIMIDTVAAALGPSEEDGRGLGGLRMIGERIHKETGATVFWSAHEGKADHNGPRGHLVLADACHAWWRLEEREGGSRVVHVDKANRGPVHVPLFAFTLKPFTAGNDVRGRPIELCELELVDLETAMACKTRLRFGTPDANEKTAGLGRLQRLLLAELHKLARRHEDGVEEGLLKSAFVGSYARQRETEQKPTLAPKRAAQAFRQTLNDLIGKRIERLDDGMLLPFVDE